VKLRGAVQYGSPCGEFPEEPMRKYETNCRLPEQKKKKTKTVEETAEKTKNKSWLQTKKKIVVKRGDWTNRRFQ